MYQKQEHLKCSFPNSTIIPYNEPVKKFKLFCSSYHIFIMKMPSILFHLRNKLLTLNERFHVLCIFLTYNHTKSSNKLLIHKLFIKPI
ncbi:hypothetical protein FWK35_00011736 [Aphis craccivora]|uniref:Uncharacterized protein n=1 Tax=Aphis craccivora TaxID=307492 RepID=A0A6G0Z9L2_APHCR|nr:hypothetical protein FWK35_00011736 [Aphis craccivora]